MACVAGVRVRSYTEPPESLLQHRSWLLRSPEGNERRIEVLDRCSDSGANAARDARRHRRSRCGRAACASAEI